MTKDILNRFKSVQNLVQDRLRAIKALEAVTEKLTAECNKTGLVFNPETGTVTGTITVTFGGEELPSSNTSIVESVETQEQPDNSTRVTDARERILDFFNKNAGMFLSRKSVIEGIGEPMPSRIDRVLNKLVDKGDIQKYGPPNNLRYRMARKVTVDPATLEEKEAAALRIIKENPFTSANAIVNHPEFANVDRGTVSKILGKLRMKNLILIKGSTRGATYVAVDN